MSRTALTYHDISIGQIFRSDAMTVTREAIKSFASQYDPQSMHLDEEAARQGPLGQLTASGWHTLSLTMRLMATSRPLGDTELVGVAVDGIRFRRPLLPDTTISVIAEVTDQRLSSKPGRGYVGMDLTTENHETAEPIVTQHWTVMVPA